MDGGLILLGPRLRRETHPLHEQILPLMSDFIHQPRSLATTYTCETERQQRGVKTSTERPEKLPKKTTEEI